jgi:hypothetical protein
VGDDLAIFAFDLNTASDAKLDVKWKAVGLSRLRMPTRVRGAGA